MIIDELITILGFEVKDKEKLNSYKESISHVVGKLQTMATVGTTAMSALLVGITSVNNETAKLANLSETVGLNFDTVNNLGSAVKDIGLNYENVIDLAEEMNNKIGESKSIYEDWLKNDKAKGKELKLVGGVEDAFKGLDFSIVDKKFKDLNLEEKFKKFSSMDVTAQFKTVLDTAATMKDAQKAASMVDILLGGEANKILSYLRKQGLTLSELIAKKNELNYLDKEGITGAKEYAKQMADTSSIFGSIGKQLSGLAGEYLAPIVKSINDWFRINKKIVQTNLKKFVEGFFFVLKRIKKILNFVWSGVDKVAKALGGWDVVLPILGVILAFLNPFFSIVVAVGLAVDDLISYFSGGKSIIGDFIAYFKTEFPLISSVIESVGNVFKSVFGLFGAIYDQFVKPVFEYFKTDSKASSDSFLSSFTGAFNGIGVVVKSFYEIVSSIFKILTDLVRGDFSAMAEHGKQLFSWLITGFDGVVMFFTNGAKTFRSMWGKAIDWIMSKIKWVTNKIDSVKSVAVDVVDNVADVGNSIANKAKSAWHSVTHFFGGEDKPKKMALAPAYAPGPSSRTNNINNHSSTKHTHNNSYNIHVTSTGDATQTAETIRNHIVNTKTIEKATINKIQPIYKAK